MNYNIQHGNFNTTITSDFSVLENKLNQFEKRFGKIAIKKTKQYAIKPMIEYVQQLMKSGGSSERKFSWGYWERKGSGDFKYRKGKSSWFTNSFTSSRKTQRYPINPKFYFLRKVRKRPKSGQFALIDTKAMIKSFMVLGAFTVGNSTHIDFGNIDKKFDIHEMGRGVPQRTMLAPTIQWFENNKKLKEDMIQAIFKELEKI